MQLSIGTICAAVGAIWASAVLPDEGREKYVTRDEIVASWQEASSWATQIETRLFEALPTITGWTCVIDEKQSQATLTPLDALPNLRLNCDHTEQSLHVFIALDARAATGLCRRIDTTKYGISAGSVKPDLFRFFENQHWRIQRGLVDLTGCSQDVLALRADGDRSEVALAAGPYSIDEFAEAILEFDVNETVVSEEFARLQDALAKLTTSLDTQSDFLVSVIPHQENFTPKSLGAIRSDTSGGAIMPLTMILSGIPSARVTIDIGNCKILVSLSAAAQSIYEAKETGDRWARPGGTDGKVKNAYMRRNTSRFVGRERIDGTGISAFVDGRVLVDVSLLGNRQCESNSSIVSQIFDRILESDFSDLGVQ